MASVTADGTQVELLQEVLLVLTLVAVDVVGIWNGAGQCADQKEPT
ncbi:hypothetical protein [Gimesia maris]|nr:hypothetical protein [Gimesia maris]